MFFNLVFCLVFTIDWFYLQLLRPRVRQWIVGVACFHQNAYYFSYTGHTCIYWWLTNSQSLTRQSLKMCSSYKREASSWLYTGGPFRYIRGIGRGSGKAESQGICMKFKEIFAGEKRENKRKKKDKADLNLVKETDVKSDMKWMTWNEWHERFESIW